MTSETTPDRPVLRVRSPGDLAALAPHLLGFHPEESLVAVALTGPRRRLGLTVRTDLADVDALRPQVLGALARERATGCALLVFTERPSGPEHPFREIVAGLTVGLAARGVEVTESLLVRRGTWWSYTCTAACCPAGGTPIDPQSRVATAVASEHAYDGRVVLASREALAASLAPCPPLGAGIAAQQQARALAALGARVGDDRDGAVRDEVDRWRRALQAWQEAPAAGVVDAAALCAGLHLLPVRDEVACWGVERGDALLGLLGLLARAVVAPDDAPLLSVLAWIAYAGGNGALAQIALRRALTTDPSYSLGRLLLTAVDAMLPPAEVRATLQRAAAPAGAPGDAPGLRGAGGARGAGRGARGRCPR